MTATTSPPTAAGRRIYFVGHSFHMFIVRPLIALAKEAGIKGHWAEGWDMIGGSTPMQHWERGGDDNDVKRALRSGKVEVLTLASNVIVPEPAIDLFADLAIAHNPSIHVMVQQSWGDAGTSAIMLARHKGITAATVPANEDRDNATAEDLATARSNAEAARARMREQLDAIDARHARPFTSIVPASEVVIRLRELALLGELPGIARQSELFRDALGHATQPTADAVTYLWFAALYGVSPVGSSVLVDDGAREQHAVLQSIAWDVATAGVGVRA